MTSGGAEKEEEVGRAFRTALERRPSWLLLADSVSTSMENNHKEATKTFRSLLRNYSEDEKERCHLLRRVAFESHCM